MSMVTPIASGSSGGRAIEPNRRTKDFASSRVQFMLCPKPPVALFSGVRASGAPNTFL